MSETDKIKALLAGAKNNDREAVKELLNELASKMYFVSRLFLKDKETAKAAEQDALKKTFRTLAEADPDTFEENVRKAVRDAAAAKLMPLDLSVIDPSAEDEADELDLRELGQRSVLNALDGMNDASRCAFVLTYFDKMNAAECAEKLGTDETTISGLLKTGASQLKAAGLSAAALKSALRRMSPVADPAPAPVRFITLEKEEPAETAPAAAEEKTIEVPQMVTPAKEIVFPADPVSVQEEKIEVKPAETPAVTNPAPERKPAEVKETMEEEEEETEKKGLGMPVRIIMLIAAVACLALLLFDTSILKILPGGGNKAPDASSTDVPASTEPSESAEPAESAQPEETAKPSHPEGSLGKAKVNISGLRIRKGPGTNYDIIGEASNGEIFEVYEVKDDGTFDWYRVGTDRWIANNGQYCTYTVYTD